MRPLSEILMELRDALQRRDIDPDHMEIVLPAHAAKKLGAVLASEFPYMVPDQAAIDGPKPTQELCHRTTGASYHIPNVVAVCHGAFISARPN